MELGHNECYITTSHEERIEILERAHECGIPIGQYTWEGRMSSRSWRRYPTLHSMNIGYLNGRTTEIDKIELTYDEFMFKVFGDGQFEPTSYKGSSIKHHFIKK